MCVTSRQQAENSWNSRCREHRREHLGASLPASGDKRKVSSPPEVKSHPHSWISLYPSSTSLCSQNRAGRVESNCRQSVASPEYLLGWNHGAGQQPLNPSCFGPSWRSLGSQVCLLGSPHPLCAQSCASCQRIQQENSITLLGALWS